MCLGIWFLNRMTNLGLGQGNLPPIHLTSAARSKKRPRRNALVARCCFLERNIFVGDRTCRRGFVLRRTLIEVVAGGRTSRAGEIASSTFAPTS